MYLLWSFCQTLMEIMSANKFTMYLWICNEMLIIKTFITGGYTVSVKYITIKMKTFQQNRMKWYVIVYLEPEGRDNIKNWFTYLLRLPVQICSWSPEFKSSCRTGKAEIRIESSSSSGKLLWGNIYCFLVIKSFND